LGAIAARTRTTSKKKSLDAARAPRPAGRRAQNKAAIRSRIVTAALNLFQTKGFDATTTREVARKAGIAEGTVFNYFKTKEDIALFFFEQEVDHAIATVRGDPRLRRAPLDEKLFALVQSQLDFLAPYERFIGAAVIQALKPTSRLSPFSHRAQELRHRYVGFVQELIEESLPKNHHGALAWVAPEAFWIYYLGALLYWLHDSSPRKQNTIAFLDRSLRIGVAMFNQGKW
jgi:AcrR family transcriptional regulator